MLERLQQTVKGDAMLQSFDPGGPVPVCSHRNIPKIHRRNFPREISAILLRSVQAQSQPVFENDWTVQPAAGSGGNSPSDASSQRLAAIVESSDDAIVAKDLDGKITDWSASAERLFGYAASEIIGKSIMILIPEDQHDEEIIIMERIRAGRRIKHFETIRVRKNGEPVVVSLSISPIRNAAGVIVGASKIARDITDRRQSQEQQELLMREMNHRIKNLFAVASSVVSLTAKSAASVRDLARTVNERLFALARAHDLTLPRIREGRFGTHLASFGELVEILLAPYQTELPNTSPRIQFSGPHIHCGSTAATAFALLLYEFATNSVKYGALSVEHGRVDLWWSCDDAFHFFWKETGGPPLVSEPNKEGFGSVLIEATIKGLRGRISQNRDLDGLSIAIDSDLTSISL